jgi:hypothetical protein
MIITDETYIDLAQYLDFLWPVEQQELEHYKLLKSFISYNEDVYASWDTLHYKKRGAYNPLDCKRLVFLWK